MKLKPKVVTERIKAFQKRFGQPYLDFACHAAFPLSLTTDLLYRIWANFKEDNQGKKIEAPYYAVADLCVSSLCREVGYGLYEMPDEIREELLKKLREDSRFGQKRIEALALFLRTYIEPYLTSEDEEEKTLAQVQQWTALAYTAPATAIQLIGKEFAQILAQTGEKIDLVWLESVVNGLEQPLGKNSPIIKYAQGMGSYSRGEEEEATEKLLEIGQLGNQCRIEGVELPIPLSILRSKKWQRRQLIQRIGWMLLTGGVAAG
ncbi:MAG: hypothetical protein AB4058_02025, partial [Microcystaceae cyanobacterium]